MRKYFFALSFIGVVACIAHPALTVATQAQQQPAASSSTSENALRSFLQDYLRMPPLDDDKTTRYFSAFIDLNGDGTEECVVYVTGQRWCGSGGCTMLVLERKDSLFRVVTRTTITRPPIRVLAKKANGWRNLAVWVQGGGIQPGYEGELRFDGNTYPSNPSTAPARRASWKAPGEIVIASPRGGTPLYP